MVTLAVQTLLMFLFASFVVFRVMGADYEAAVMTAAFCGFGMGATPQRHGQYADHQEPVRPRTQGVLCRPPWWAVCSSTSRTLPF